MNVTSRRSMTTAPVASPLNTARENSLGSREVQLAGDRDGRRSHRRLP